MKKKSSHKQIKMAPFNLNEFIKYLQSVPGGKEAIEEIGSGELKILVKRVFICRYLDIYLNDLPLEGSK